MLKNTIMTFDKYIPSIVDNVVCQHHNALTGEPCHILLSGSNGGIVMNVCDKRARKAGMNGVISADSVTRTSRRS